MANLHKLLVSSAIALPLLLSGISNLEAAGGRPDVQIQTVDRGGHRGGHDGRSWRHGDRGWRGDWNNRYYYSYPNRGYYYNYYPYQYYSNYPNYYYYNSPNNYDNDGYYYYYPNNQYYYQYGW